jgi:2-phospho-L-lactate guanylyltransferase
VSKTTVVIPLRGLHGGKSRLAPVLDPAQRSTLIAELARHVLGVVLDSQIADDVVFVTREQGLSTSLGFDSRVVTFLRQPDASPGMNAAINIGRRHALQQGAANLLVLSADLPWLSEEDLLAIWTENVDVVVGTDRLRRGTNALLLRGDRVISEFQFEFGIDSRAMHRSAASRLGVSHGELIAPGIALDLDTPDDWAMLSPGSRQRLLSHTPASSSSHIGVIEKDSIAVLEHA